MYQADRRPWLRVRIDPPSPSPSPSPSPASSFRASLRLDRWGAWAWGGGVTSSLVLLLLLLSGEGSGGSGDSARGASSSVFTARGRPRRLGVDAVPESDNTDVSCADDVPPSSPVDWSRSSSGVELLRLLLLLISSSSCLLFLPLFLPGGRPRGLEGLPGVAASGGLTGASARDFRPLLPTPTVTWLLWPFKWTVLGDEGLTGEPEKRRRRKYVSVAGRTDQMYIYFLNYKPTPHFVVTASLTRCVSNRSSEFPAGASSAATFRGWGGRHLFRSWWCWSRHRVVSPQWASRLCRQET